MKLLDKKIKELKDKNKTKENIKEIKNINTHDVLDIETLYDIKTVYEEYYLTKDDKIVIIFNIEPIIITHLTVDIKEKIYNIYNEFLKSLNYDIKIYIQNDKFKVKEYKESANSYKDMLKKEYIDNLRTLVHENDVYLKKYYILITLSRQSEIVEVEKQVYSLKNIGLNINKVCSKNEIKLLIQESVKR